MLRYLSTRNTRYISIMASTTGVTGHDEQLRKALAETTEKFNRIRERFAAEATAKYDNELQQLRSQVEKLRTSINEAEEAAGTPVVPANYKLQPSEIAATAAALAAEPEQKLTESSEQKPKKSEKQQPTKGEAKASGGAKNKKQEPAVEDTIDIGRLDLRVGRILEAKRHPDADALYVETIDVGEENPRTVISGLVKHIPLEQMQDRLVVCLCNLKPVKMRGIESQAMVMCASTAEKVEIMEVAADSTPGARIITGNFVPRPDAVLNPKKKVWETCAVDLKVSADGKAIWRDVELLVDGKTPMTAPTLREVSIK